MNKSRLFKVPFLLLCVIGTAVYGQKETKVYKEIYNVNSETVLDIDTSNADIQFETWDKDQIEIEASIELEGATAEEAKRYFEREAFEIIGNSKKVSVTTRHSSTWVLGNNFQDRSLPHFDNGVSFEIQDLFSNLNHIDGDSLFYSYEHLESLPPMPPVPSTNFDYAAFKKDGHKYLKKWQSEFKEGFGKEYQTRMKAWQKEFEANHKKTQKKHAKLLKKSAREQAELNKKLAKSRVALKGLQFRTDSLRSFFRHRDSTLNQRPNIFYFSSDGENKNYKVKKSIKIKMPKGNKIKMDVRHGEVKLAANTLNIDADLSYSNLLAFEIDGAATNVRASYSPIFVEKWNLGQLQTEYSDAVNLKEVVDLRLTSTSSEVTIDRLSDKAIIKNEFGPLVIKSVASGFSDLDVSLHNAELNCEMPNTAFTIYVNGTSSKLTIPAAIKIERSKNGSTLIHKGFFKNKQSGKSIVINSKYSNVVID